MTRREDEYLAQYGETPIQFLARMKKSDQPQTLPEAIIENLQVKGLEPEAADLAAMELIYRSIPPGTQAAIYEGDIPTFYMESEAKAQRELAKMEKKLPAIKGRFSVGPYTRTIPVDMDPLTVMELEESYIGKRREAQRSDPRSERPIMDLIGKEILPWFGVRPWRMGDLRQTGRGIVKIHRMIPDGRWHVEYITGPLAYSNKRFLNIPAPVTASPGPQIAPQYSKYSFDEDTQYDLNGIFSAMFPDAFNELLTEMKIARGGEEPFIDEVYAMIEEHFGPWLQVVINTYERIKKEGKLQQLREGKIPWSKLEY